MANKISRRQILSLGAATIAGGVAVLGKESQATTHGGGSVQLSAVRLDNRNLRAIVRIGRRATAADPSM